FFGGGGGITNHGTLTVANSTLSGNSAFNIGFSSRLGGAISNDGTLTVANSTLSGNSGDDGGGILNNGTLTVTASTFSGNSVGIFNTRSATLVNTTVANSTSGGGDLSSSDGGTFSGQNNLIGDGSFLSSLTNSISGNPLLSPLGNYGGPTQTFALLSGSPAFNAGDNAFADALGFDQRGPGFLRIKFGTVDIGAYEQQNQSPVAGAGGPYVVAEGGSLTLDASASFDADGDPLTDYTWDVNGDNVFG